ncbi:acetyl-CoA carboxylase biotin carboxyl carrier protein subunit [Marinifilum breve]|uniref:Acetyl-CoA carboxylase biotin carboxyl carrier protein subunit n=1 Tax=Marinifilum breve TaxID=2184082 RepID=A0A2V3ZSS7_9BACT|nr:biotin/lipoyl-containing protein [Marinifilum breve]PXX96190.1 acetyl-CoA carboxylase biotin carboxyl carrier protein subunit [Marinifilum breve]
MENLKEFNVDGTVYKTELTKKFESRKNWERPNPKHLHSFIPGTIVEIFVKEGQEVKAGESLMILEAMKMKNQIEMPFDGVIKKIHVEEGVKVPNKMLMVEIE